MEKFGIKIDDKEEFDKVIKNSLPDGGDITLITKEGATNGGKPAIMLTFSVQLPDGSIATAQTVTTVRLFLAAAGAIRAKYGHLEF